jgi:hypothetical protein
VTVLVEFQVGDGQPGRGFGFPCAAAQHGPDPGQHLAEAERLLM